MSTIPGMIRDKSGKDQGKLPKGVIAVAPPSFRRERALIKRGYQLRDHTIAPPDVSTPAEGSPIIIASGARRSTRETIPPGPNDGVRGFCPIWTEPLVSRSAGSTRWPVFPFPARDLSSVPRSEHPITEPRPCR